jgi:Xaa-Pro aminopeptidase
VLCLEPGAYDPEIGGVRLEWTFLVEEDGAVLLVPVADLLAPFA